MEQNDPKQTAKPENIEITITNQTTCGDIMIIGRQIEKIDGWLKINIFIGQRHSPVAKTASNVN